MGYSSYVVRRETTHGSPEKDSAHFFYTLRFLPAVCGRLRNWEDLYVAGKKSARNRVFYSRLHCSVIGHTVPRQESVT
ncbi:hypothetical protein GJAV_G00135180 [Gymnothorax javanicus]|nr:hypothetical protein GJAV_G00135180 [Gymnothorax javanicus]